MEKPQLVSICLSLVSALHLWCTHTYILSSLSNEDLFLKREASITSLGPWLLYMYPSPSLNWALSNSSQNHVLNPQGAQFLAYRRRSKSASWPNIWQSEGAAGEPVWRLSAIIPHQRMGHWTFTPSQRTTNYNVNWSRSPLEWEVYSKAATITLNLGFVSTISPLSTFSIDTISVGVGFAT